MQNSYTYRLTEAKEFLESLPINKESNALWDVLHQASWHKGIDWVLWIERNKELINELIHYDFLLKHLKYYKMKYGIYF